MEKRSPLQTDAMPLQADQARDSPLSLLLRDPRAVQLHARLLGLLRRDAYTSGEVVLASGKTSDFYIDCRRVTLASEGHFLVGKLMGAVIVNSYPEVEAVGGLTMGADPIASATATLSYLGPRPLDAFYIRKEAKAHGKQKWVESAPLPDKTPVAIVEDVVTSGGSALRAVERAEAAGLIPRVVIALVDRQEGGAATIETRLPLVSLFSKADFK
jgi:orotate phosphoribosyltransferase